VGLGRGVKRPVRAARRGQDPGGPGGQRAL